MAEAALVLEITSLVLMIVLTLAGYAELKKDGKWPPRK